MVHHMLATLRPSRPFSPCNTATTFRSPSSPTRLTSIANTCSDKASTLHNLSPLPSSRPSWPRRRGPQEQMTSLLRLSSNDSPTCSFILTTLRVMRSLIARDICQELGNPPAIFINVQAPTMRETGCALCLVDALFWQRRRCSSHRTPWAAQTSPLLTQGVETNMDSAGHPSTHRGHCANRLRSCRPYRRDVRRTIRPPFHRPRLAASRTFYRRKAWSSLMQQPTPMNLHPSPSSFIHPPSSFIHHPTIIHHIEKPSLLTSRASTTHAVSAKQPRNYAPRLAATDDARLHFVFIVPGNWVGRSGSHIDYLDRQHLRTGTL